MSSLRKAHAGSLEDNRLEKEESFLIALFMSSSISKSSIYTLISLLAASFLYSGNDFPTRGELDSFKKDLSRIAMISNVANTQGTDYYIGVSSSFAGMNSVTEGIQMLPALRLSIYPNPGYNIWAQFASLASDKPTFSVGTGIQVAFQGENLRNGQALGVSWNKIYGDGYNQRDISVHGMLTRFSTRLDFGLMAVYDMHHVLIESVSNFKSYDETILSMIPYIKWTANEPFLVSASVPVAANGVSIQLDFEYLLGKRK